MIAVIQGSNRAGNATRAFVDHIRAHLANTGVESSLIDVEAMPGSVLHPRMYEEGTESAFLDAAEKTLRAADRWIIVFPEYNGSYPGALKLFIDALSVRDLTTLFGGKLIGLVGTASGRAGNLRGIDHLSVVLGSVGAVVLPQSLPISLVHTLVDESGQLADADTEKAIGAYLDRLLQFSTGCVTAEEV